jgi:hypothetical protein
MMNPLDEQRPAAQVLIFAAIIGIVTLAREYVGPITAIVLLTLCLLCVPASIAILGLESSFLRAAYPVAWIRMIVGLGISYALVLGCIAFEALLLTITAKLGLWLVVRLAAFMFCVLSVFSLLAGAVYERRDALGIDTWKSPERDAERERRDTIREDERTVTEAYGLLRAREHVKSWNLLQSWLANHDHNPDAYRWLCDRVAHWNDSRYANRLTEELVSRLLAGRRTGEAIDAVSHRLEADATFRPASSADTLAIAQLAAKGGKIRVARMLLADFASRFPADPRQPIVDTLAKHLER